MSGPLAPSFVSVLTVTGVHLWSVTTMALVTFFTVMKGVTQGDPVAMVAYGLSTLPLIHQLKTEFPELQHAWYADDSAVAGSWTHISHHFHHLQQLGSTNGYFPEATTKSVLVVSPSHQLAAQAFFSHLGVKVCTGHHYL